MRDYRGAVLGAKVLLLEKDRFPRQKVCGEFVSPESLGLLHGFLEDGTVSNLALRSASSRIFLDDQILTLPVSPAAQSIPRFDLDAALFVAAQNAGVTAHEGVAVHEVQRDELFHVTHAGKHVCCARGRERHWTMVKAHAI